MEPQVVYDRLCAGLSDAQMPLSELLSLVAPGDVQAEVERMKKLRGTSTGLTDWELRNAKAYAEILDQKGEPYEQQVYAIGQRPEKVFKAANCGVLPLLTATDRYLWARGQKGPLLPVQKFAAHGFPVNDELAEALGVPVTSSQEKHHILQML